MCGIVGIVRFDNKKIDKANLIQISDTIHHRGPDDSGIYINGKGSVALAHRRLSIIDISSLGHQPMSSRDESIWLVQNGEIYNFLEIKKELENLGYTFISNSDTEVVLKAYEEWGEESFEKFNGMFAFSIYDRNKDLIYLVRDHAGIKPLYYAFSNEYLIFSSEIKALKVFDKHWEEFKYWKIFFLIFGYIPEPYTTLKDVYMLPKGTFLRLDIMTMKYEFKRFFEINFIEKITDEQDAIEQVNDKFIKAVKRHLISDAPIGVFLSGGIDSSLITLIAHYFQKDKLRTLSVVFKEKEFSEGYYQNIVLKKIRTKHNSYLVTEKDFIDNLDDIFQSMDQPTVDGVNTFFIAKCAKEEGLKSVLSGLGGDELFGGYPSFKRIEKIWGIVHLNKNILELFKLSELFTNERLKKLAFLSLPNPMSFYLLNRGLFTPITVSSILGCYTKDVSVALEKLDVKVDTHIGKQNLISYLETELYMKNQLLKDSDFMSMRHSVEVRMPFLDKELMELIFSINEDVKFRRNIPKFLLVKTFKDILPEEIVKRKKHGFTFPFDLWMKRIGKGIFEEAISKGDTNKKNAEKLLYKFGCANLHWSRVWALFVLGNFK